MGIRIPERHQSIFPIATPGMPTHKLWLFGGFLSMIWRPKRRFGSFPNPSILRCPMTQKFSTMPTWIKDGLELKIGWQKKDSGMTADYPRALEEPNLESGFGFAPKAADQLVFAGSHYHKTLPQDLGTIRYSLDFRAVHLADAKADRGAPNADNRSRGSTLTDYIQPSQFA